MNITLRTKIFIVGGLIIGFLLAIALSLYIFRDKNKKNGNLPVPEQGVENTQKEATPPSPYINNNNPGPQNKVIEAPAKIEQTSQEVYVKQLAALFTERLNTFSNRNNNVHVEDALALSTADMAARLEAYKIPQEGEYRGTTTKIVASSINSLSSDQAKVSVDVEQKIYQANLPEVSKFKSGTVYLSRVNGFWKVSGFSWEE